MLCFEFIGNNVITIHLKFNFQSELLSIIMVRTKKKKKFILEMCSLHFPFSLPSWQRSRSLRTLQQEARSKTEKWCNFSVMMMMYILLFRSRYIFSGLCVFYIYSCRYMYRQCIIYTLLSFLLFCFL